MISRYRVEIEKAIAIFDLLREMDDPSLTPKDKAESGCKGGYDSVLAYVAKVSAPGALPPGTPTPP